MIQRIFLWIMESYQLFLVTAKRLNSYVFAFFEKSFYNDDYDLNNLSANKALKAQITTGYTMCING